MKRYEVRIAASADKELARMPGMLRQRIIEKFDEISKDLRGMDSKKLDEATYRVRVEITGSCITLMMRNTQS